MHIVLAVTLVELFVDPSCPWAWNAAQWLRAVAPRRSLSVRWRSYCLEIRDEFAVPAATPDHLRPRVEAGRALSHRMLRIFEAARVAAGEDAVDRLYAAWGARFFGALDSLDERLLRECIRTATLDESLVAAADDATWDDVIAQSMAAAYAVGGDRTQTPVLLIHGDPPRGFKGPVLAPAPTGEDAAGVWDAVVLLARTPGMFELSRPRTNPPLAMPAPPPA